MANESPPVSGSATFHAGADAYDRFMGRYSRPLATAFADRCLPSDAGTRFLDVGCGPGALTEVAVQRLGASSVVAVDPTPGFVEAFRARHRGVEVHRAPAEHLPFAGGEFDAAAAQLVFHFVSDPERGAAEMARVVRPGGVVAACVWDFDEGMEMLRSFWDAALALDAQAPDEARTLRFGSPGELTALLRRAGLQHVAETTLTVHSTYADFDELWATFLLGIGPAGAYAASRSPEEQAALRAELFGQLGRPAGSFDLRAVARAARGTR